MYMSKVGIHYPSLVSFFSSNKREPRGPRTWIILKKMYMFGNFRYLSQRERESFKRERERVSKEREREFQEREKDESTQAEKVVSRLNR